MTRVEAEPLTIVRIWQLARRYGVTVAAIMLVSVAASLALAFVLPPVFRSAVVLAPSRNVDGENGFSGASGGALGLLKGLQSPQVTITMEAVAVLQSRQFIEKFIEQRDLLPMIFSERWDASTGQWFKEPPALEDGYLRFIRSSLKVQQDDETGFVKVQVYSSSSATATAWANELVDDLNAEIRERVVNESSADLKFLNERMREAEVPEIRSSVADLILDRTKEVMLATNRESYAFRVLEKAAPSKYRYHPKRALIATAGFIIGMLLSIAFIGLKEAWTKAKRP